MMVTSGSDPERRRRPSVGEAGLVGSASSHRAYFQPLHWANALNPRLALRRPLLGFTPRSIAGRTIIPLSLCGLSANSRIRSTAKRTFSLSS